MLYKDFTAAEIAAAKPFIEKYILHLQNMYKPNTLYDDIAAQMTKKVVTFDLINRLTKELELLVHRPLNTEGNPNDRGNIIRIPQTLTGPQR